MSESENINKKINNLKNRYLKKAKETIEYSKAPFKPVEKTIKNLSEQAEIFKRQPKNEPKSIFSFLSRSKNKKNEKKNENRNSIITENLNLNVSDLGNIGDTLNLNVNAQLLLGKYITEKKKSTNNYKKILNNIIKRKNINLKLNHQLYNENEKNELKKLQNIIKTERYILDNMQENIKKLESKWFYSKTKNNKNKISNYKGKKNSTEKSIKEKVEQIKTIVKENDRKKLRNLMGMSKNEIKKHYEIIKTQHQNTVAGVKHMNWKALKTK